jgi:hypothetical protein
VRRLLLAHPGHMEPVRTPRPWGNMTVPPLFGWENILVVLLVLVAIAVAFFIITAAGPAASERQDWQRFLESRSGRSADPGDRAGEPVGGADVGGRRPPA